MKLNENQLKEKHSERYQELERQLREKDAILDNYRKEHGKLEIFFNKVIEYIKPITPLPHLQLESPKSKHGSPIVAVMQVSDSHYGAVQEPMEIEDFNAYSPAICDTRSISYANRFVEWVNSHRTNYSINECAILVTGDLISGLIHQELEITNAFPTPVQCVGAAEVLTKQISIVASAFNKVVVHFIVADNHARLTHKPQMKEAGYNSLNYVVGKMAEIYTSKHNNVDFRIYPQVEKVVNVNGRQYLISHGDGVIGWGGLPIYGIERKVAKESMARMQIIMSDANRSKEIGFHKMVFGHWHTPFDMGLYSCCGSVSGTDAYDHKNGRFSIPSQSAWMVSSKWGEFDRINFRLA